MADAPQDAPSEVWVAHDPNLATRGFLVGHPCDSFNTWPVNRYVRADLAAPQEAARKWNEETFGPFSAPQVPVTSADCDGTNALLRHAQSLTAPGPEDADVCAKHYDAEWNAACEACAKACDTYALTRLECAYERREAAEKCASACRAIKR